MAETWLPAFYEPASRPPTLLRGAWTRAATGALRESPEHPQFAPRASTDPGPEGSLRNPQPASTTPSLLPGPTQEWLTRLPGGRQAKHCKRRVRLRDGSKRTAPHPGCPLRAQPGLVPERPLPAASGTRGPTGCGLPDPTPPNCLAPLPSFTCLPYYLGYKL